MNCRSSPNAILLACLLIAAIASAPLPAAAAEEEAAGDNPFAGVGSIVCTLVYSPLKLTYAASGLVIGGLAWVWSFGRPRVTRPIFTAALHGDYVVLPEHLTGEKKLEFIGRR